METLESSPYSLQSLQSYIIAPKGSLVALLKEFLVVFVQPIWHPLSQQVMFVRARCFAASSRQLQYRNLAVVHGLAKTNFRGHKALETSLQYKKLLFGVKMVLPRKAIRSSQSWQIRTCRKGRTNKTAPISIFKRPGQTFLEKTSKSKSLTIQRWQYQKVPVRI